MFRCINPVRDMFNRGITFTMFKGFGKSFTGICRQWAVIAMLLGLPVALSACDNVKKEAVYPTTMGGKRYEAGEEKESVFGEGGLKGLLGNADEEGGSGGGGIGVNSFLWRASLDTISFMPITSADPFGGVILTDWYSNPESPDERFKMNVYILDRQLRSDGLKVTVFKQKRAGRDWQDAAVSGETAKSIEDTILTRARELRVAQRPKQ